MKRNIILTASLLMIVNTLIVTSVAIYFVITKNKEEIKKFEQSEINELKNKLIYLTDIPYTLIQHHHEQLQNDTFLLKYIKKDFLAAGTSVSISDAELLNDYSDRAKKKYWERVLKDIEAMYYNDGKGYFFITDNKLPFPRMIMHPIRPYYNNQEMKHKKYNTEKYEKKNIYTARAELCNIEGACFIEYQINKPDKKKFENKISYSRLFSPLGWIVSTGLYTDQIQLAIEAKRHAMRQQINNIIMIIIGTMVLLLIVYIVIVERLVNKLVLAVNSVKDRLKELSKGHRVSKFDVKRKDEIKDMTDSLNALVDSVDMYIGFAKQIGNGNLKVCFTALSTKDILGNALLNMQKSLKDAVTKENERKWSIEKKIAFGDVLRKNSHSLKVLGEEVLNFLTVHLSVQQGAIYTVQEKDDALHTTKLSLLACYAYYNKQVVTASVEVGEGLVGQCFVQKKMIRLSEIPDDYTNIKSGLGETSPSEIVILPLVDEHNKNVCYGVLEIASLCKFNTQEIKFLDSVCSILALTINRVQVNEHNLYLLEQSHKIMEELRTQEEELRQNMEELQSVQESLTKNNTLLVAQNTKINGSLNYAFNIQQALLPAKKVFDRYFAESFIFFKPKDVVSGDFYWVSKVDKQVFVAVIDCTGHGIPGAFMSMISNTLLNETVNEKKITSPADIMRCVHSGIFHGLQQEFSGNKDGMDMSLCRFEEKENGKINLTFTGAKQTIYIHTNEKLRSLQGDRISIGGEFNHIKQKDFTEQVVELKEGDMVYMTTDGLLDMPNAARRSFGKKRFSILLDKIAALDVKQQESQLSEGMNEYSGKIPQRDDILTIGLRVKLFSKQAGSK